MFLGSTSSRRRLVQLLAPPAVAQRDRDRALGGLLADDEAIELGDDLARGQGAHARQLDRLEGQMRVGVDADVGRDRHRLAGDRLGGHALDVEQRARRGERERPARADADQAVVRLEHVAVAGEQQRDLGVGDRHHRLEPAQIAVGAPVLGELDRGPHQLAGMALELGLEPLEQREGIRRAAGEPGQDPAAGEPAHLARAGLEDGVLQS